MLSKAELRRQLRASRAALSPAERHSAAVLAAAHFAGLSMRPLRVAAYLEYGSELSTRPLLDWFWSHGVEVYVPKTPKIGGMYFVRIHAHTHLRGNHYGIPEPVGRCERRGIKQMDVIVLPLLGFDAHGNRLGSGGGYYDRGLAFPRPQHKPFYAGYAYSMQQVKAIPVEKWDVRLDAVITEKGVMRWLTG